MLAVALQTNDNDQEHLSVSRQDIRSTKSEHFIDMGYGIASIQTTHCAEQSSANAHG